MRVPVHEEEAASETPAQQENAHSETSTTPTRIKGSSIPLEHMDLLRPVSTGKEHESSPGGDEEEEQ